MTWIKKESKMNDIIEDIEVLQNAIIAFTEGASDEKRTALHSMGVLVAKKQHILDTFEKEMAPKTA